ncbi:MAG TPA: bifunctional nicotinamidase/pyrazinamidase [Casimicrobiaceae bacterium]|nr:bifunctional nicotinamidase/pyrazinamidase [Casimicrobiaceae bacterium]
MRYDSNMSGSLSDRDILLVVDVQHDFLPGGALAVPEGDAIIPIVNRLACQFMHVALTQDWHPPGHLSFASSHPGKVPFQTIMLPYGEQVLWPDHCMQGTFGAEISPAIDIPHAQFVVRKGHRRDVDSYSAFVEADRTTPTGLAGYLRERGFTRVFLAGLATDFCVAWSALDGRKAGFDVVVVEDACRAIDTGGSRATAWTRMRDAGVRRVTSDQMHE